MKTIDRMILDITSVAHDLPTGKEVSEMEKVPRDMFDAYSKMILDLFHLKSQVDRKTKGFTHRTFGDHGELALSIVDHDLVNFYEVAPEKYPTLWEGSLHFINVINYLCSEDPNQLKPSSLDTLELFKVQNTLNRNNNTPENLVIEVQGDFPVTSDQFFTAYQIRKNAEPQASEYWNQKFKLIDNPTLDKRTRRKQRREYITENRRLKIEVGLEDSQIRLKISDNGLGIAPKILPKIFGSYTTKHKGGLGLQYVNTLAELRGYDLTVYSSQEGGKTFEYHPQKGVKKSDLELDHGTIFDIKFSSS